MSRQRSSDTQVIATKAELRQIALKRAVDIADEKKKQAIKAANEPINDGCFLVIILIFVLVIAFPATGVLILFA